MGPRFVRANLDPHHAQYRHVQQRRLGGDQKIQLAAPGLAACRVL